MKRTSPDVLFVCVHNAGRSQIAKALFNARARATGLEMTADAAGTLPSAHVHPEVIEVMRERGIDLSQEHGKPLTDELLAGAPRVITMGCDVDSDACPALLLSEVEDWGLRDPKGQPIAVVREIRDEIDALVTGLVREMRGRNRPTPEANRSGC